jgi:hypothetical protein
MPVNVRDKLAASAEAMLGGSARHGNQAATTHPEGWARRVLANLEAHVSNGVPLTEESRQAMAEHNEAMSRIAVGDLVSVDNSGNVIPAGLFRQAVARVVAIGENGQVQLMPLSPESRTLLEARFGSRQPPTPQEFVREHMNVPPPPNPSTPGGQARIGRQIAQARNPPPQASELPPVRGPMRRFAEEEEQRAQEDMLREQQMAALEALLRAGSRRPFEEDSTPPVPVNPLQQAIPVIEGRPKRRILRKRNKDESV